jgi:hypothetical protein
MSGAGTGQVVGQEGPSQFSPRSTTLFPQTGGQSLSVAFVAPGGQQRSPEIGVVISVWPQAGWQPFVRK